MLSRYFQENLGSGMELEPSLEKHCSELLLKSRSGKSLGRLSVWGSGSYLRFPLLANQVKGNFTPGKKRCRYAFCDGLTHTHTYIHTYIHTYTHTQFPLIYFLPLMIKVCVCVCVCVYVCVCVCVCVQQELKCVEN